MRNMNEQMELNGALCAAEGAADTAQAAPAAGKKKYVPPTMQVIPLGPQRMLATSAPITLSVPTYDYYFCCNGDYSTSGTLGDFPICTAAEAHSLAAGMNVWAAKVESAAYAWFDNTAGTGFIRTLENQPSRKIKPKFSGVNWDVEHFFANATFDSCDEGRLTGTYNGQKFSIGLVEGRHYCSGWAGHNGCEEHDGDGWYFSEGYW